MRTWSAQKFIGHTELNPLKATNAEELVRYINGLYRGAKSR